MINGKVEDKLKAVEWAVKDLDRAAKTLGRVGIRNARRSLWARIRALQAECDAQYTLPKKVQAPLTIDAKAKRMTAIGFDRELVEPEWWLRNLKTDPDVKDAPQSIIDRHFHGIAEITTRACSRYGVLVPVIEPDQVAALNLGGSGHLGIKGATFANFVRALAKWTLWAQGELKQLKKSKRVTKMSKSGKVHTKWVRPKPGDTTADGTIEVNLRMLEILKLSPDLGTVIQDAIEQRET